MDTSILDAVLNAFLKAFMANWQIFAVVIFALVLAIAVIGVFSKKDRIAISRPLGVSFPYRLKHSFMNQSEFAFYHELHKQLGQNFYIFSKTRLIDFIDVIGRADLSSRNRIISKHIDFLVLDQHMRPLLGIEVDGFSHNKPDRIDRDGFIDDVFAAVGLELRHVRVGTDFRAEIANIADSLNTRI